MQLCRRPSGKGCACIAIAFARCSGCGFRVLSCVVGLCHRRKHHPIALLLQPGHPAPGTCSAGTRQPWPPPLAMPFPKCWQDHRYSAGKWESHCCQGELMWTEKFLLSGRGKEIPMVPSVTAIGKDTAFTQGFPLQLPCKRMTSPHFPKYKPKYKTC